MQLTLARDTLLHHHVADPDGPRLRAAAAQQATPSVPTHSERMSPYGQSRRELARRGLGPSIAAVCALAAVLVGIVSLHDSTRAQFATVGTDLTAGVIVATVHDPAAYASECRDTTSCTLLDMTAPQDCRSARARFEVSTGRSADGRQTESRELGAVSAGWPTRVVLDGADPLLVYLGCEPG